MFNCMQGLFATLPISQQMWVLVWRACDKHWNNTLIVMHVGVHCATTAAHSSPCPGCPYNGHCSVPKFSAVYSVALLCDHCFLWLAEQVGV